MMYTLINVIVCEPGKQPYLKSIPNTITAKELLVGGPYCCARWRKHGLTFIYGRNRDNQNIPINSYMGISFRGTFLLARSNGLSIASVNEDDVKHLLSCS